VYPPPSSVEYRRSNPEPNRTTFHKVRRQTDPRVRRLDGRRARQKRRLD